MAIGAPGSSQQPRDTSNILENVWATIMTEAPTGCTPMPASSSTASTKRMRRSGATATDHARTVDADLTAVYGNGSSDQMVSFASSRRDHGTPTVQDRRVMSADVGGAVNRVIEVEEIGSEYWDYLFPPLV
ncbi:hypothetical protein TRIUR3_21185 [Triticum urartu]|uniref:Uncharacterized protein n=2 Tax=Triticum TaxID=4564 RepID=A0A9R0UZM6_TRITD|nr:hypothetical protein TRIUR3_21185 [Triticum urartu]VAH10491.1 unnamed protein product [Triticum turgidum subsp. durum]